MPDLLLELFSEEIPARMQKRAEQDLARLMAGALAEHGLAASATKAYSGPRRLTFVAEGVPALSAATTEERKGPRVGSPAKAIEGFLRAADLKSPNDCIVVSDPKGDYYLARMERPGRAAASIIAETVPEIVRKFPWPKSMRWGAGRIRWVRPLHSILCLFDNKPVEFEVDGIRSGDVTYGHRFLSGQKVTEPKSIRIVRNSDYPQALLHAKVVLAGEDRIEVIREASHQAALKAGLSLVEDHGLLAENAGLVEWPVVLTGKFDESFLDVPEEILMTAMKAHQRCFSLRYPSGKLANRFILVANLEAEDGGKAIIAGNERVIRARLSDAKFFWDHDKARPLGKLTDLLGQVIFHEKLGTQLQRVERIERLARELSPLVGADAGDAARAAHLAKADLMSETVSEFPELQGVIGRYIALAQGEKPAVANAIADHYKPQGPSDAVPSNPVSIAVALADKLDMLVGFWIIGERPTGSRDPFALRRAALGVIRAILEKELRVRLAAIFENARKAFTLGAEASSIDRQPEQQLPSLLEFFADRLKVHLREQGARHDLIDAVFALPGQDDLLIIVRRVEALGRFLETEEGANLLTLVRRALNILRIEEKKDGRRYEGTPAVKLLHQKEEKALNNAIRTIGKQVDAAVASEQFENAMAVLSMLRAPVDAFFEKVTVNTENAEVRETRLLLLAQIRALTFKIADFSKIEG